MFFWNWGLYPQVGVWQFLRRLFGNWDVTNKLGFVGLCIVQNKAESLWRITLQPQPQPEESPPAAHLWGEFTAASPKLWGIPFAASGSLLCPLYSSVPCSGERDRAKNGIVQMKHLQACPVFHRSPFQGWARGHPSNSARESSSANTKCY